MKGFVFDIEIFFEPIVIQALKYRSRHHPPFTDGVTSSVHREKFVSNILSCAGPILPFSSSFPTLVIFFQKGKQS